MFIIACQKFASNIWKNKFGFKYKLQRILETNLK